MSFLLPIAARIEAAVAAYNSVRDFAGNQEWRENFKRENVSTHLHGV